MIFQQQKTWIIARQSTERLGVIQQIFFSIKLMQFIFISTSTLIQPARKSVLVALHFITFSFSHIPLIISQNLLTIQRSNIFRLTSFFKQCSFLRIPNISLNQSSMHLALYPSTGEKYCNALIAQKTKNCRNIFISITEKKSSSQPPAPQSLFPEIST